VFEKSGILYSDSRILEILRYAGNGDELAILFIDAREDYAVTGDDLRRLRRLVIGNSGVNG
jgi:hypothetical protein